MNLTEIDIRYFRSITNLKFNVATDDLNIFCGANNVGKTNVLRAIEFYFAADLQFFDTENDVPYHIAQGARGKGYKVEILGTFIDNNDEYKITVRYIPKIRGEEAKVEVEGKKISSKQITNLTSEDSLAILASYRVIFIEATNLDLPKIISEIFISEVLPDLDKARKKGSESLRQLKEFENTSKAAMSSIETGLTKQIQSFSDSEGLNSNTWSARIRFPEFNKLRDAISRLVDFTIQDTNDLTLEFKGSGAQKIVLLAIMRYIAEQDSRGLIWLIDEPEAFLQPALQKQVFREIRTLSAKIHVFITTHSQYFVDQMNLKHTHLLITDHEKTKNYARIKNRTFIINPTKLEKSEGSEKIIRIKSQLGITNNDSWSVLPHNLLVEGEDDKLHIITMLEKLEKSYPNILFAGGADKIKGYIPFLSEFSDDLSFKPKVLCILDHDEKGKSVFNAINPAKERRVDLEKMYVCRTLDQGSPVKDFEFEDMIPHSILISAINKLLRRKNYRTIRQDSLKNRYNAAFDSANVMSRITALVGIRNESLPAINFEQGIKMEVNRLVDDIIRNMSHEEFSKIVNENLGLKDFIEKIERFSSKS